ncbi:putative tellurium resistance membrane protein TerC [Lewinella aquimaris]|uniref:Putative tellurium resistance membrane protein TerC n=1 Tax=Neolewinella aquimaris TaxID=1835722 RepID=A0A840DWC2_9BACT|nr:TerC family protein [Neolewinella aquimaris]MBB4077474.1 putative tellurium resistance membrane protein TerC [Neolewinella aquimaris]
MFTIPDFGSGAVWLSLLTLTFLEIVLGIDNIIFISIASGKLKNEADRKRATNIGLILAMALRVALLFAVSWLVSLEESFVSFDWGWASAGFSGQSLILIAGGIFLLYKSTSEIHHKLEGDEHVDGDPGTPSVGASLQSVIVQITIINIVFSFDSILTAVGMTNGLVGALIIMIIAVIVSVLIMMLFAVPVGNFVNRNPTVQMLGLAFLILIGFMLIIEGAHLGHLNVFDNEIGTVPKGYLYFAIAFSLLVEFLNMKIRPKGMGTQVKLNTYAQEAADKTDYIRME